MQMSNISTFTSPGMKENNLLHYYVYLCKDLSLLHSEKNFVQILKNCFFNFIFSIQSKNTFRTNINLFDFKKSPF